MERASPVVGRPLAAWRLPLDVGWHRARTRWVTLGGVALLLALTVGLSFLAFAGARRTQSSYPRLLRWGDASTMVVTTFGSFDPVTNAKIAAFPEVVRSRTYVGLNVNILDTAGHPDFSRPFEAVGTFDGLYFDQDRFVTTSGRMADPTRADEAVVNEFAADRLGLVVGEHLDMGVYSLEQWSDPAFYTNPSPPMVRSAVTVVGIGLFSDEVVQDDADRTSRVLFTRAFSEAARPYVTYGLQGLVLVGGDADVAAVRERVSAAVPPGGVEFGVTSVNRVQTLQAVRPLSIALALFGVVAGFAGLVLVTQSLRRLLRAERREQSVLRALGWTPREIGLAALVGPVLAILAGTGLAVVLAVLASPTMPIGPVRRPEVDRGIDVDLAVLGVGAFVVLLALAGSTAVVVFRTLPHRLARRGDRMRRPSRLLSGAAAAGLGPTGMSGLRFTLAPGAGAVEVPPSAAIIGAIAATAALVGAFTFNASLQTLVDRPDLYGWNWDAAALAANGYGNLDEALATDILTGDDAVSEWSGTFFGSDVIDGREVPLLGVRPGSPVEPPILRGRSVAGPTDIVLGRATAARLDVDLGDEVTLGPASSPRRLRVVGIATFPTIGPVHVAHTSLGVGAMVDVSLIPGADLDMTGVRRAGLGPNVIFVRFRDGVDRAAELTRLRAITAPLAGFAGLDVLAVQRPAAIVYADSMGSAPVLLAAALALGSIVALVLALGASLRGHRRDLALLRMLGFTSRQVSATVAWHATTLIVAGLVVGMPLGLIGGREAWTVFAGQLDVVTRPRVPVLAMATLVVAALTIANVAAAVHGRAARRTSPTTLLRSE